MRPVKSDDLRTGVAQGLSAYESVYPALRRSSQ